MEAMRKSLPPNPRGTANIFSILTFWWTIDLFKVGYRKALELGDLFQPMPRDTSEVLGDRLEKYVVEERPQCNFTARPANKS